MGFAFRLGLPALKLSQSDEQLSLYLVSSLGRKFTISPLSIISGVEFFSYCSVICLLNGLLLYKKK